MCFFRKKKKNDKPDGYEFYNLYTNTKVFFPKLAPLPIDAKYFQYEMTQEQLENEWNYVESINEALKENRFCKDLQIYKDGIEQMWYSFNPYTPKGKISENPCIANIRFRTKEGIPYSLSITFDKCDVPKTASYFLAYYMKSACVFTVKLHYVKGRFYVTKVISDRELYHIRKEDL